MTENEEATPEDITRHLEYIEHHAVSWTSIFARTSEDAGERLEKVKAHPHYPWFQELKRINQSMHIRREFLDYDEEWLVEGIEEPLDLQRWMNKVWHWTATEYNRLEKQIVDDVRTEMYGGEEE